MLNLFPSRTTLRDERFQLSLLVMATGLVLTLQNPEARESAGELLSRVDLPDVAQVMDMRPQTPPPWLEGDQSTSRDDIENSAPTALLDRERARLATSRERPVRATTADAE